MKKKFLTPLILTLLVSLSSCMKEPSGAIAISAPTVSLDEPVTVTLSNLENYTCIGWRIEFDGEYTTLAGGTGTDVEWSLSFREAGEAKISALVKNCKKKDNEDEEGCYCQKNHLTSTYEVALVIG